MKVGSKLGQKASRVVDREALGFVYVLSWTGYGIVTD
jgi:hypothetical protein